MKWPYMILSLAFWLPAAMGRAETPVEVGTAEEFNAAAARLQPGGELVVRDGVYSNWKLEIPCKGTESAPVVIRPKSAGGVLLRRATVIRITGNFVQLRGFHFEHCGPGPVVNIAGGCNDRITECRFLWCGNPRSTFTKIVEVGELAHDNRVDHCYWEGSKSMSLGLRITSQERLGLRSRFDHNTFRDIFPLSGNGQESVQIGQGGISGPCRPGVVVEYNTFDRADGDPEAISNKSSGNTYRYNVLAWCRGAMVLRGGEDCLVEGNVFLHGKQGIRIHGTGHTVINNLIVDQDYAILMPLGSAGHAQVERCLVAHNTIVEPRHAGLRVGKFDQDATLPPLKNRIVNNLFTASKGVLLDLGGATDNEVSDNLFWLRKKATAGFAARQSVAADPRLLGAEAETHPGPDSPAIDRAMPLGEVVRDRWGAPRPAGNGPDIGADELQPAGSAVERVELPAIPPERPAFDFEALKDKPLFAIDPASPLKGIVAEADARITIQEGVLRLENAAVWLSDELPGDFVAEWEYSPESLESKGTLRFASPGRQDGYALAFGGAEGAAPDGVITLAKGEPGQIVADGHDTLLSADKHPRLPNPKLWYTCRLAKRSGWLHFDLGRSPVVIWNDKGLVGGPTCGPGAIGFSQAGTGSWRNLRVWSCK